VSSGPVVAFQAGGDVGWGVFGASHHLPADHHGFGTPKRGSDWVQVNIQTSGLPTGACTVWSVIFDAPDGCTDGSGADDLFNPDADVSVLFATGGVVGRGGAANFTARYAAGDDLDEPGTQHMLGDGSHDPARADVHNVIKYHGPAPTTPPR
jgi:hypothetical protein